MLRTIKFINPRAKLVCVILLIGITIFGFYLRSKNAFEKGITLRDEAWYLFGTQGLMHRIFASADKYLPSLNSLPKFYHSDPSLEIFENISSCNLQGKPFYLALTALISIFCANAPIKEFPTFALSILSGTVSIILVYVISNHIWKRRWQAVSAALLFAVSPLSVYYSRIGTPQMPLVLFFLFFLMMFVKSEFSGSNKISAHLLIGASLGIALSIHPVFLITIGMFFLFESLVFVREKPANFIKKIVPIIIGLFLVIFFWEASYFAGNKTLIKKGIFSTNGFYLTDLFAHGRGAGLYFKHAIYNASSYLSTLISIEGLATFLLFFISMIFVLRPANKYNTETKVTFFLMTIFFSTLVIASPLGGGMRNLATIFPIISLLSGLGNYMLYDFIRRRFSKNVSLLVCGSLLTAAVCNSLLNASLLLGPNGAWKQMGNYLAQNYKDKAIAVSGDGVDNFFEISDSASISFYLGKAVKLPNSRKDFFDTCDLYVYNLPSFHNPRYGEFTRIYTPLKPIAEFPDPLRYRRLSLAIDGSWPVLPFYRYLASYPAKFRKDDEKIRLYNVNDIERSFPR